MINSISEYLSLDHERIGLLLERATLRPEKIDTDAYAAFRQRLLRHIGIEEKMLIPVIQPFMDETTQRVLETIRADHSALVSLLVPEPFPIVIAALKDILSKHHHREEQNGGFYELGIALPPEEIEQLAEKMKNAPEVKPLPNNSDPRILEATRRALERAGYRLEDYQQA